MTALRQRQLLAVLGVSCLLGCSASTPVPQPAALQPPVPAVPAVLDIVLLAGQSNMAGRGPIEPSDRIPAPHVWMLDRDGHWQPAADPVHYDKPVAAVGPGRSFGIAVAAATGHDIGLVPAAVGGSSITSWVPGGYDRATQTHPYDDALARARAAMQRGPLVAILWHQGESDTDSLLAPPYAERLRAMIGRLRTDLHASDTPFLIGQLGHYADRPWTPWDSTVDAAHQAAARDLAHVAFVPSTGLVHRGDRLHFDAASARELGRRFAAAYLTMSRR